MIEVMIALAVVAILVTVAHASYQEHLRKGRRAAAQAFLVDVANRQQQYLMDARVYAVGATSLATLNMTVPPDVARFYAVTVQPEADATPPRFTIVATPVAGTQQASDGVLTITDRGARARNGVTGW